jgi:hypothetical protein
MKNVIDWFKLVVMVLTMVNWIFVSNFGFFWQLVGLVSFGAGFALWMTSDQFTKVKNYLMKED